MRYVLIYLTASQNIFSEWFYFYVLISLLDLDTRHNMYDQNEPVLVHYKGSITIWTSKIILRIKKFQLAVNFKYPRYLTLEC